MTRVSVVDSASRHAICTKLVSAIRSRICASRKMQGLRGEETPTFLPSLAESNLCLCKPVGVGAEPEDLLQQLKPHGKVGAVVQRRQALPACNDRLEQQVCGQNGCKRVKRAGRKTNILLTIREAVDILSVSDRASKVHSVLSSKISVGGVSGSVEERGEREREKGRERVKERE
jgi:hypothetical protein